MINLFCVADAVIVLLIFDFFFLFPLQCVPSSPKGVVTLSQGGQIRTDQIDHGVDDLASNLPLRDAVQDWRVEGAHPIEETMSY